MWYSERAWHTVPLYKGIDRTRTKRLTIILNFKAQQLLNGRSQEEIMRAVNERLPRLLAGEVVGNAVATAMDSVVRASITGNRMASKALANEKPATEARASVSPR